MEAAVPKLRYLIDQEIRELGIRASVVAEVSGLTIRPAEPELEELKQKAAAKITSLTDEAIAANPILESYRSLVHGRGRSLKKFPPAAESLIRQVWRTRAFPSINTAVDSYNIIAAERFLALGVHDAAKLGDTIYFRISEGGEPFVPVGGVDTKFTGRGDFVYADDTRVLAWLDAKDSDEVKISLPTNDLIIIIQGTEATTREYNLRAATEACQLITRFCGGDYDIFSVD
jgi:DNA/RNA-binding domain of Phe-tRNA-synthetase-like protein